LVGDVTPNPSFREGRGRWFRMGRNIAHRTTDDETRDADATLDE
jgi:hypothetical protein